MRAPLSLVALLASAVPCSVVPAQGQETLIVLNKSEASASLIEPETGEVRATVAVGVGPHEVAVSPDGKTAVVCNYGQRVPGNTLTVIDVAAGKATRTFELEEEVGEDKFRHIEVQRLNRPHGISFLPDGEHVVVTSESSRKLVVVNLEHGRTRTVGTKAEGSHMVALTPDATRAFVANIGSGSVSAVDLEKGELLGRVETGRGAEGIAVHPTRGECWVTNRSADTISVIDTEKLEVVAEIECGSFPIRIAFTPDGKSALVSNARSGEVAILDVAKREIIETIGMDEKVVDADAGRLFADFEGSPVPVGILVQPDGKRAYVANTRADIVTVLDLETWRVIGRLRAGKEPDGMAWSSIE